MNEIVKQGESHHIKPQAAAAPSMPWKLTVPADPETPMAMISRAVASGASMEMVKELLDLRNLIAEQEAKAEYANAKAEAMSEMPTVPMSGRGHNGRPYATLRDITSITKPVLARHGLSLGFDVQVESDAVIVRAKLLHRNGYEELTPPMQMPLDKSGSKNSIQAIGSSQTYGERYTAQALLGLSLGDDLDDDGRVAGVGPTITAEQFETLRDKLEASGSDEGQFLRFFGADDLHTFPSAKFADAVRALDQKAKQNAKRGDANA